MFILVILTGCSTYEGLDPTFARETKIRNRIAIQWCVVRKLPPVPEDAGSLAELIIADAKAVLTDKGFVVHEFSTGVDVNEYTRDPLTKASFRDIKDELIDLHESGNAYDDDNPIAIRQFPWPPASLSADALKEVDTLLFVAFDCILESNVQREKRHKEERILIPISIALLPLVPFGINVRHPPILSSISSSVFLVDAQDGRLLYRRHIFLEQSDVRRRGRRLSAVEELFGALPRGE